MSLALLALFATFGGFTTIPEPLAESYLVSVRRAADAVPSQIGGWFGRDVPPTPAAVEMLKPNTILQREYYNPEWNETVSVLFVHCGDVRDMQGHFPPVCYPAHGWAAVSTQRIELTIGGAACPGRMYGFRWPDGTEGRSMRVVNFFVAPSDDGVNVAPDPDALRAAMARQKVTSIGAAQIQLVMPDSLTASERTLVIEDFLPKLEPLIETVCQDPRTILREGEEDE